MRFMHLADLHIGKKVNGFSMLEDQRFVLLQVLKVAGGQQLDGVLLAGDIYDKGIPSAEAVQLLDWFLTELSKLQLPVYMVSGNHDSGERLSFGAKLLQRSRIYVASVYDGKLEPIELEDEYGKLRLYLLPFIKPVHVRRALQNMDLERNCKETEASECALQENMGDGIKTYQEAMEMVLEQAGIEGKERNVLVAHQLVTGAARCDSEEVSVGGLDNIDAMVFRDFDYVALGHIHGPQSMTRETVRYAGTLLKYSFSECRHNKSITVVELKEKGNVSIETIPVQPLHDMREIKGEYSQLMAANLNQSSTREDYLRVILTDEAEVLEALGRLRTVYPNIMRLEYENTRTRQSVDLQETKVDENETPLEYFEAFYEMQNNQKMSGMQRQIVSDLIEKIWG